MDLASCQEDINECLNLVDLRLCDIDKDICREHGWCITSIIDSNFSICVCYPCYYGDRCENEAFSKNLWIVGQASQTPQMVMALKFFLFFTSIIQIINGLICLQTYFSSKKIRRTNLGVYLIVSSIISLLAGLNVLIPRILLQYARQLPERFWQIQCQIDQKFVLISLAYMWDWSLLFLAFERMLIECFHCSPFQSKKRSFIISTLIFIICPLTTIPGIFTMKNLQANQVSALTTILLTSVSCVNYTPLGYTIFKVISSVHGYGSLLSYTIISLIVFLHLLRHRKRVAPKSTTLQNIRLVLYKHRDFFILLLIPLVCAMPIVVLNETMNCTKASNSKSLPYLMLVFGSILGLIPTSLSFFYHIYPADVYMVAFWNSPVGRFLRMLRRKTIQICRRLNNTSRTTA